MSGPKSSRYILTAEQRRIIIGEMLRQRRILEEKTLIEQERQALQALPAQLDALERDSKLLVKRTGEGTEMIRAITECRAKIQDAIRITSDGSTEPELLQRDRKRLESVRIKTTQTIHKLKAESGGVQKKLDADISSSIAKGFSTSFAHIKNESSEIADKKAIVVAKLDELLMLSDLPGPLSDEIRRVKASLDNISSLPYLESFQTVSVLPLTKKVEAYISKWEADGKRYQELQAQYLSLCELLGAQPRVPPFSAEAVAALEKEIAEMEQKLLVTREQVYISQSIDSVMQEMGYDMIGSRNVQKRSGKRFRNELYTFSEGTAVNVTYDSEGKIVMELGGLDDTDRVPDRDETERLCHDMYSFCGEFEEIERRLEARGVVLGTRIDLLPPDGSYAQIINTSDYDMQEAVSTIKVKRIQENQQKAEHIDHE